MMTATQTTEKRAQAHTRVMRPLNVGRPAIKKLRANLARKLARFLRSQAPKIAAQISELAGLQKARNYIEGEGGEAYAALRRELFESSAYRDGVFIMGRDEAEAIVARHPELSIERQSSGARYYTIKTPEGFTLGPPKRGAALPAATTGRGGSAEIDALIAKIDFSGWTILVGDVEGDIEAVIKESAYAALAQVGIEVEARPEIRNIVDERAVAYARERGAEMVGMRVDALGRLVENPNAFWRITDPTRDYVRADVTKAIAEGWSNDRLSKALSEAYGFSEARALVIARTETNRAASIGALAGYKASGVVDAKQWLTAEDDLVSEECQQNGVAGPGGDGVLPLDADYPSGDDAPPVHPNCRCAIAPVVDLMAPVDAATATPPEGVPGTPVPTVAPRAQPVVDYRGGNVSQGFRDLVTTFVANLPDGVAAALSRVNMVFVQGDRALSIDPRLKGVHPRGYPAGATFDSVPGFFNPASREIVTAETYRPIGKKTFVTRPVDELRGTLAHETGHAVDRMLGIEGKIEYNESRRAEFMAAYKLDAKGVRAAGRADPLGIVQGRYRYYMQKGEAGPSEAFAEAFGQLLNGARRGVDMRAMFPRVTEYIERLLLEIEA